MLYAAYFGNRFNWERMKLPKKISHNSLLTRLETYLVAMSLNTITGSASTQERDEFKRLYRRSIDPTEFVSQEDLRRMEELKQK